MTGTDAPRAVLLDTCALIWIGNQGRLASPATDAIVFAAQAGGVFVSPVSAWEIGLLARPKGGRAGLQFIPDPKTWFDRILRRPGTRLAALTPDIAIESSSLPGTLHSDPGDRLIVATARHNGIPIVTRDAPIIAYGRAGHVGVIRC